MVGLSVTRPGRRPTLGIEPWWRSGGEIRAPCNTNLIIPAAKNGVAELANIRTLCLSCDKGRYRSREEGSSDLL